MGTLYIVATPIGNLQDITLRALETIERVDFIASEDTRKTSILINHYFKDNKQIHAKLFSYYEQTEIKKIPQIINLLKNGKDVALISDAGTPTISDPGFKLVRESIEEGIKVISIPGPSSVLSSLVSSGLPTDKFLFLGFLPKKPGHRLSLLKNLKKSQELIAATVIIFESPHKIYMTLTDMINIFGDIEISVARELTKVHETTLRNNISEFIKIYQKNDPKGEIVILFSLKT